MAYLISKQVPIGNISSNLLPQNITIQVPYLQHLVFSYHQVLIFRVMMH